MNLMRAARRNFTLGAEAIGLLMPMHVLIDAKGGIVGGGPTMRKLMEGKPFLGFDFFDVFEVRRPFGLVNLAALQAKVGARIYLNARALPSTGFRGVAVPLAAGEGVLVNLSFGIGLVDAVRDHALTDADFATTDLAIELLYVVEAKSAVMHELRDLNLRLQGAKSVAEEQALTDTLTGLRNRRALDLALAQAAEAAAPFALMHLDLDFFKAVNDTLGHAAGDHVLRRVAQVLTDETRAHDTVARVGGDEFVMLLPGLTDASRLEQIAQRIIARLCEPIPYEGQSCHIAASVGVTASTLYDRPHPDLMLQDADNALYSAKRAGRGCVRVHLAPPQEPEAKLSKAMKA